MAKSIRALAAAALMTSGVAIATPAHSWSWRDDEAGQKLDSEARHWLTAQNVCGVQLKADYLRDLESRIGSHFTSMADVYRQFLLSSVWSANAEFLSAAKPADVKRECEERVAEAVRAGMLADPKAQPYPWATSKTGSGLVASKRGDLGDQDADRQKSALTGAEKEALGDLVTIIGKPKSDAEAIAQNTIIMLSGGEVCGYRERIVKYKQKNSREIQGAIAAAYGSTGQREIERITTGVSKWLNGAKSPIAARNSLCKMLDASFSHMGF